MSRFLPQTPLEVWLEVLSLIGLLGGALFLIVLWSQLPAEVPAHFDVAGNVTRYDPKGSLWELVRSSAGMYALLSVANLFPKVWNLPGDPEDRPRQLQLARTFMYGLKAFVVWLFTFILWISIRAAQGAAMGLSWWFLPLGIFVPLILIVTWLVLANREPTTKDNT